MPITTNSTSRPIACSCGMQQSMAYQRTTSQGPEAKPLKSNARSCTVGASLQARMRMSGPLILSGERPGAVGRVSTWSFPLLPG